jgi:signal transduction histidine kinase
MKQQAMNVQEYQARSRAVMQAAEPATKGRSPVRHGTVASVGAMRPLWMDDTLLLVRPVTAAGREAVEGCWLDWPVLEETLLAQVSDLLPGSRLEPLRGDGADAGERRMAALPVRLVPGMPPAVNGEGMSAARLSLLVAWGCTLAAAVAATLLVGGVVALSERRAAFVSAVTHELRTPLTTFRMYTEMLRDGMVPDPERQRSYLNTLAGEAVRLDHLVHNVLAYARLERGRGVGEVERVAVAALLDRTGERLEERARQAGMELELAVEEEAQDAAVNADSAALERVMFNLVDNACRYAAGADDPRLHLEVAVAGRHLELAVRDHGPGVPAEVARRLFRPFAKSARAAAESAPGVGLGLALSRRLARRMGGDLALDRRHAGGARFVLRLPLA